MRRIAVFVLGLASAALGIGAPTYINGFDPSVAQSLGTNSLTALNTYLGGATPIGVLNFESSVLGTTNATFSTSGLPTITFACGSCDATLSGVRNDPDVHGEFGYNTTGATTSTSHAGNYYRVTGSIGGGGVATTSVVTLSFSSPITAFGAYLTGIETFLGTTVVTFNDGSPQTALPNPLSNTGTSPGANAGIQFFGIYDAAGFSSLTFTTTNPTPLQRDVWGIDDITLGTLSTAPEPATFALMGAALLGLGALRFRKR